MDIRQVIAKVHDDEGAREAAERFFRGRQPVNHALGEVLALGRAIREGINSASMGVSNELAWAEFRALADALLAQYEPQRQRRLLGQAIYVAEGGWRRSEALIWALDAAEILPTASHPDRWHKYRAGSGERMLRLHEVVEEARAGNLQQRLAL